MGTHDMEIVQSVAEIPEYISLIRFFCYLASSISVEPGKKIWNVQL